LQKLGLLASVLWQVILRFPTGVAGVDIQA